MRVVSLACSNTEIVCALGCADRLVGVDSHSDFPPAVIDPLPKVGPDLEIDVEKVAALDPDLVLATLTVPGHEEVVEKLESSGLPYIAPAPQSVDDVYRNIREIGTLLGVAERSEELIEDMQADLGDGRWRRSRGSGGLLHEELRPTVLVQWWPKPTIAPGRRSWTTDVIRAAGGRNVLQDEPVKSRPLDDEEVRMLDPDAIVVSWCGVHPDRYRPEVVREKQTWCDMKAIRNNRVHCVPEAFLGRPGPRLTDGVRALRAVVEEIQQSPGYREPDPEEMPRPG